VSCAEAGVRLVSHEMAAPEGYEHGRLAGVAVRLAGAPVLSQAPARPLATFGSLDEGMPIRRSAAASGPGVPERALQV
jgi:hypothetical protein